MSTATTILAAIASDGFFGQVEPLLKRSSLQVTRVQSGAHALTLARESPYDLVVCQHPLPDMGFREFFSTLRAPDGASTKSSLLVLTRDDRLEMLSEYLDGNLTQACCIDAAPEQLRMALNELVGIAVRARARLGVELEAQLEDQEVKRFCQTVNVSETGLLLRFRGVLPVGSDLALAVHLPDAAAPIQAGARVVRRTDPSREQVEGLAVQLVHLEDDQRRRLADYIDQQVNRSG